MKGFYEYDHGAEKNLELYGSEVPPMTDFTKIQNTKVPIALYAGDTD